MKVIPLNDATFPGALFEAVKAVKRGGVIVYPTDTVYGIGGDALDAKVAEQIYRIKERPRNKGFILLVRDHKEARKYAYIDLWTEKVLEELWPGPVSVILHKKDNIPDVVSGGLNTIALRMPKSRFSVDLLRHVEVPLIATSANRSEDSMSSQSLDDFLIYLETQKIKPDLVLDAGVLPPSSPSTILDLTNRKQPAILRKGVLTKSELELMLRQPLT